MELDALLSQVVAVGAGITLPDGSGKTPLARDFNNLIPNPSQGDCPQLIHVLRPVRQTRATFGYGAHGEQRITVQVDYLHVAYNLDYLPNASPLIILFAKAYLKAFLGAAGQWSNESANVTITMTGMPEKLSEYNPPFLGTRFTLEILNYA